MGHQPPPGVDTFNSDIEHNAGYLYTTNTQLSSQFATQRSTDVILQIGHFAGRSILDIGCGDGFYTIHFWDQAQPRSMVGVDAAEKAIQQANVSKQERPITFAVGDAHHLPYPDNAFDLVLIQSILHHDNRPLDTIREAFRLAPEILIHEPNGNNMGLKIIERTSAYHRKHGEKSYSSRQIKRWITQTGGKIAAERFAGFVPMFCPDWLARATKRIEPIVEQVPLMRMLMCAVYVVVGVRNGSHDQA